MDPRETGLAPIFLSTRFAFSRWQSCQLLRLGLSRGSSGNRAAHVEAEIAIRRDMAKELTQRTTMIIKMSTD